MKTQQKKVKNMKCNFHTHTSYCDGKDTPEELACEAVEKGFTDLGFSGHGYNWPDRDFAMSAETAAVYRKDVRAVAEKYKGKLRILCGIEQDYFSDEPTDGYDFVIGSVHWVFKDGVYISVDESADSFKRSVDDFYGGNYEAIAADYFALEADVLNKTKADIIGHFDLITKFNEILGYKETTKFLEDAEKAVDALIPFGKPFEINTGAIARGYRTTPYPSFEILKIIFEKGGDIMITSDCHDKTKLDCAFSEAASLARKAGFSRQAVLTGKGFDYIDLL